MWNARNIILLLLVLILGRSAGQKYPFAYFTIKEGLPHSQVCDLFEDHKGNIWMPTLGGGLSVCNGKEFKTFSKKNGLRHLSVRCIAEDANGIIYAGTFGGALYKVVNDTAILLTETAFKSDVFGLCVWKDELMIGTGNGLFSWDGKRFRNISAEKKIPEGPVTFLNTDHKGRLWFGYDSEFGLFRYDGRSILIFNERNGLHKERILNVYHDRNNEHWVAAHNGVYRIKAEGEFAVKDLTPGLPENYVFDFAEGGAGIIYIASNNAGITIYDTARKKTEPIDHRHGLRSDLAFRMLMDSEGNLWVSNWGDGVARMLRTGLSRYDADAGLKYKVINSLFEGGNELFISSSGNIASARLNEEKIPEGAFAEVRGSEGQNISKTFFVSEKDYWVMHPAGLVHYENGKKTAWPGDSLTMKRSAAKDREGNIYFGGWGSGLIKYEPAMKGKKGRFVKLEDTLVQKSVSIYSVFIDSKNVLWVGTWGGGLLRFDGKKWTSLDEKSGLHSNRITALCEDRHGNIFAGSGDAGVAMIKPNGKILVFTQAEIPSLNSINALAAQDDWIWLGEIGHLERIKIKDDKIAAVEKWEEQEGFSGDVMFDGIMIAKDGSVWIGTSEFVYHYEEKKKFLPNDEVMVFISGWKVKEREFIPGKEAMAFRHNENRVTFSFFTTRKFRPEDVQFRYRMSGLDTAFTHVKNNNDIVFHELPSGDYTFEIFAKWKGRVSAPAEISFSINPPFWKTWWFYLLCAVSAAGCVIVFIRQRELKLRKDKILLEKTVIERTREIQQQKSIVEQKNKEILDSIRYAKRIQNALLTPETYIGRHLRRLKKENPEDKK